MKRPIFLPQAVQLCFFYALFAFVVSHPTDWPASVPNPTLRSAHQQWATPFIATEIVAARDNHDANRGTSSVKMREDSNTSENNQNADPDEPSIEVPEGSGNEENTDPDNSSAEKKPNGSGNEENTDPDNSSAEKQPNGSGNEENTDPDNSSVGKKPNGSGNEENTDPDDSSVGKQPNGSGNPVDNTLEDSIELTGEEGTNVGVIVGGVAGGVAALLVIAVAVRFAVRPRIVEDVPEIDIRDNRNGAPSYVDAAVAQRLSRDPSHNQLV